MAADHGHGRSGRNSHNGRGQGDYCPQGYSWYGYSGGQYYRYYSYPNEEHRYPYISGSHYEWVYHYGRFGPYWSYELVY